MTVQLSISTTCDTAHIDVSVANFVDLVVVEITDGAGNVTVKTFDTVPAAPGQLPLRYDIDQMFPGELDLVGLPPGTLSVAVTETTEGGIVSGPDSDSSHRASATVGGSCSSTSVPTSDTAAPTTSTVGATSSTAGSATTIAVTTTAGAGPATTIAVTTTSAGAGSVTTIAAAPPTASAASTTAAASGNTLPATGSDSAPLVGAGFGFLIAGCLAVAAARRRSAHAGR